MDDTMYRSSQAGAARRALANSSSTAVLSPRATRHAAQQQRPLGSVGGHKLGPGYSPYARRVKQQQQPHARAAAELVHDDDDGDDDDGDEDEPSPPSTAQRRTGLLGAVGRAFGSIFSRSNSSKQLLPQSNTIADLRAQLAETDHFAPSTTTPNDSPIRSRRNGAGVGGMSRSSTVHNLAATAVGPPPMASTSAASRQTALASSASLSALSSRAAPTPRSAHSTLVLPPSSRQRAIGSPAPSSALSTTSTSYAANRQQRSPSPTRNMLAGSVSAFNLRGMPTSPTRGDGQHQNIFGGGLADAEANNSFGLPSRSPFRSARAQSPSIPRSASVSGTSMSLFPYTSTLPRGHSQRALSPAASSSGSAAGHKRSYTALSATTGNTSPRSVAMRMGSPLNPSYGAAASDLSMDLDDGAHAKKKQLVWDPAKGLVSRESLERDRAKQAPPPPKNEAERILEVLEGLGRTPLGDARRGAMGMGSARRHIHVPASDLTRSLSTPLLSSSSTASPYAHRRPAAHARLAGPGTGLESQLRARDERRRLAMEEAARARQREDVDGRDRNSRTVDISEDEDDRDGRRRVDEMEQDEEEEKERPRRKTRSMATSTPAKTPQKGGKGRKAPSRSPAPPPSTARKTRTSKRRTEEEDEQPEEEAVELQEDRRRKRAQLSPPPTTTASKRRTTRSKSPAVAEEPAPTPAKARSATPPPPTPPPAKSPSPAATPSAPAQPQHQQRSSLRPGKSHSSRQHTASSKIFSAREEDLPTVDEGDLGKIVMPVMKFPAGGFNFGPAAGVANPAEAKKTDAVPSINLGALAPAAEEKKKVDGASASNGLLGRLGSPPSTKATPTSTPAFSFAPAPKPAAVSATPAAPAPAFSFNAPAPAPPAAASTPALPKSASASSDFFSKPAESTSFSFTASSKPVASTADTSSSSGKPSFFGAVLENKSVPAAAPPTSAPASFSGFGSKPAAPAAANESSAPPSAPASNPFASIGKPVSAILKEAEEGKKGEQSTAASVPAPTPAPSFSGFGFGNTNGSTGGAGLFGAKPASESKTEVAPAANGASPFSFKPSAPASAAPAPAASAASPFSFGATAVKTPAAPTPFSAGPSTSSPFSFGSTAAKPAAPVASDGKPSLTFSFGKPTASSVPPIESADEDSGMEDGGADDESAVRSPVATASAAPFSFSLNSPSGTSSTPAFGAPSSSFSFGQPAKKEASPTPFSFGGSPAPASTAASPAPSFGGGAATPTFGGFSPSPSPAPQSPAVASGGFTFGAPASTAPAASSPFAFGSTPAFGASSNPSPFGAPSAAPASTGFSFGATSVAPPTTGLFGAPAMSQTMSAPGLANGSASPFGAASPTAAAPSTGFNFGASTAAQPSTSGGSPFQFGAAAAGGAPPAFGGFGAAPTAASAPGTPTGATTPGAGVGGGGMFNIGSGGEESPNKRRIAPLRRRK